MDSSSSGDLLANSVRGLQSNLDCSMISGNIYFSQIYFQFKNGFTRNNYRIDKFIPLYYLKRGCNFLQGDTVPFSACKLREMGAIASSHREKKFHSCSNTGANMRRLGEQISQLDQPALFWIAWFVLWLSAVGCGGKRGDCYLIDVTTIKRNNAAACEYIVILHTMSFILFVTIMQNLLMFKAGGCGFFTTSVIIKPYNFGTFNYILFQ